MYAQCVAYARIEPRDNMDLLVILIMHMYVWGWADSSARGKINAPMARASLI